MTTSVKTCFKCSEDKPLDDFYKHKGMSGGRLNKCKECTKSDVSTNRLKNIGYYRDYDKGRGSRQGYPYVKSTRKKYPVQYKAQTTLNNAIRSGDVVKPDSCEICGNEGYIVGHHDDYLKPLDVRWLCQPCHCAWHREYGEAKNRF